MANDTGGIHLITDCHSHSPLLAHREHVEGWVRAAARDMGMTILSLTGYDLRNAHEQEPGVSVLALLAESHMSVHTWPGESIVTMDAYSCRGFDADRLFRHFRIWFDVREKPMVYQVIERFGIVSKEAALSKAGQGEG